MLRRQQRQRVHDALEKLATTQLHPTVFGRGEGDARAERALARSLKEARDRLTPSMLGVAPAFANGASWATSALLLRRLERYRAPADKVTMMVNACRLIERRMHALAQEANAAAALRSDSQERAETNGEAPSKEEGPSFTVVGADEFFPVLLYVLLIAAPPTLPSELAYISRFRHPSRLRGVSGCYFTHVRAALEFLGAGARSGWGHPSLLCPQPAAGGGGGAEPSGGGSGDARAQAPMSAANAIGLYSTCANAGEASLASGQYQSWREWLFAREEESASQEVAAPVAAAAASSSSGGACGDDAASGGPHPGAEAEARKETDAAAAQPRAARMGSIFGGLMAGPDCMASDKPIEDDTAAAAPMTAHVARPPHQQDDVAGLVSAAAGNDSQLLFAENEEKVPRPASCVVSYDAEPRAEQSTVSSAALFGFY